MANLFSSVIYGAPSASYTFGANYATPLENKIDFGTPTLAFLKIAALATATPVDISAVAYRAAIARGVQGFAELYGMGVTDTGSPYDVVVIVKASTANGAEPASNVQAATYGAMEAAIAAQLVAAGASTVTSAVVTPYSQFTGDILAT